jgi:hypothetical protein
MTKKNKITFKLRRPQTPVEGPEGPQGAPGVDGQDGGRGERGPQGPAGERGAAGPKGAPGARKFTELTDAPSELTPLKYVRSNAAGTKLELVPPPKSETVFMGGAGSRGAPGPAGPPGTSHEHVPQSATLTRDVNGDVETVTVEGKAAWVITRDAGGRIASLSDGAYDVAVDRDEDGAVEGVTSTEL